MFQLKYLGCGITVSFCLPWCSLVLLEMRVYCDYYSGTNLRERESIEFLILLYFHNLFVVNVFL